jgi:quercetin dioxygenase-like cupin family protein
MTRRLIGTACLLAAGAAAAEARGAADVLLDNPRVRVLRANAIAGHPAAVVVPLRDTAAGKAGEAFWSGEARDIATKDIAPAQDTGPGAFVVVEPKPPSPQEPPAAPVDGGSRPGQQPFKGISFAPLFENDRVSVLRARMEVGAEEAFHTHARDVIVVHLSGGTIEDTAGGKTVVNRWEPGDVELEARGSGHSARNMGPAIDVVLVTLKP